MSLRIVLIGQAAFGAETLRRLAPDHEILSVWAPPAREGKPEDPLVEAANELGLPVRRPSSMKAPEVAAEIAAAKADLGVLAFVTVIVPPEVIDAPRLGTICFHPSLLPRYRGGSAINWQIINRERQGGLTVFWADSGIDTGPILLRRDVPIGAGDTAGSFYYEKIFPAGVDAMAEAVGLIDAGDAPRVPQDESAATYDPLCKDEHVAIDWKTPGDRLLALVRGADPQPGAWARWNGEVVRFYDAELSIPGLDAPPGTVTAVDDRGVHVSLADGKLVAGRVRVGRGKKEPPAADGIFEVGRRFENGDAGA